MWRVLAILLAQSVDFQADGIKALDAKQYDAAVELFQKAIVADSKDYAAHFHLGLAYSLQGKDAEAIPEYKLVLELAPRLYEAQLNLGISLLRSKDAAGALPYLKDAAAQRPKEPRPVFHLAQAYLETGQWSDAETNFLTALALEPSAASELGLGKAIAKSGRLSDAEAHYRKAASIDPVYKNALLELAAMCEDKQQTSQAIVIYRDFPDNPGAQERMGALLVQSGQAADAISALESAVAKSPTEANRVALAQAYVKNKQIDKAAPLVAQVLQTAPDDFELRMFYGRLLRDQRKFAEAAPQFLAATKIKPESAQPWNEMAAVMIAADQYPQALAALDQVRARGGETNAHYYFRAISYDHLHQLKEALANYNRFLESSQGKNPDEEFKARQRARIIQNELNRK